MEVETGVEAGAGAGAEAEAGIGGGTGPEDERPPFARRLSSARAVAGLSQDALARLVPVSRSQITRLELGNRRPTPELARRLDEVLAAGGDLVAAAAGTRPAARGPAAEWPRRIGRIPGVAECFQTRPVTGLREAAGAGADSGRPAPAGPAAAVPPPSTHILTGAGGVGKTQAAARFAADTWAAGAVDLLMWVTADSRDAVVAEYARAGVSVAGAESADREAAASWFLGWLGQTRRPWLIVLDDLARPGDLAGLWPPATPVGRTVVTTRRRDAALSGPGRATVEVSAFSRPQAVGYLRAKLAVHGRTAPDADLAALADALGHLPIALAQAVAYQIDTGLDCAAYLRRLADSRRTLATLVPEDQGLPDEQRTGLAAVWSWSIQHADALPPAGLARPLLELASVLDPNGIPLAVLTSRPALEYLWNRRAESATGTENAATAGPAAGSGTAPALDADTAEDALHCLRRVSLIAVDGERPDQIVRVHALVQRSVREALGPAGVDRAVTAAADALADVWPMILQHYAPAPVLEANVDQLRAHGSDDPLLRAGHDVLFQSGWARGADRFAEAGLAYWGRLAADAERRIGPDRPYTLAVRHELADTRGQLGHYAEARDELRTLIPRCRAVLGPDHFETLSGRHALVTWRGFAGDPAGAAAAAADLAVDWQRVAGPDSPDAIAARQSHGLWLAQSGDVIGAIRHHEELGAHITRVRGPFDFLNLSLLPYLAHWRRLLGEPPAPPESGPVQLPGVLSDPPQDHALVLVLRAVTALWQGRDGDAAGGAAELHTILADYRRIGPDHFDALIARHYLAELTGRSGDRPGAVAAFEALLGDLVPRFGPHHPTTLLARHGHAHWRSAGAAGPGDAAEVVARYQTLAADFGRHLAPDHPETAAVRHNLACRLASAGDRAAARALLDDVLRTMDRIHTRDHPRTRTARRNQAALTSGGHPADLRLIDPAEPQSHVSLSTLARIRRFHAGRS